MRRFSTRDVRAHFKRFYGAANMVLAVAGPVRMRTVERQSRAAFARVPRGERRAPRPPRPAGTGPRFRAVHNESAQTQVHILFHALPETDPDYLALRALVRVLDDGMSTRLHYQICDQKGLAYSIAGSLHSYHDAALLEIDAACAHAKLPALVGESLGMLGRFRDELVGEDELDKAKRRFVGDIEACYDNLDGLVRLVRRHRALHARRPAGEAGARARPRSARAHPGRRPPGDPPRAPVGHLGRRAQPEARPPGREDRPRVSLRTPPRLVLLLLRGDAGGVTSMARVTVSLTGLQACSWQRTKCASAPMVFLPASVAETGMSKRALSFALAARSPRVSLAFFTVSPAAASAPR